MLEHADAEQSSGPWPATAPPVAKLPNDGRELISRKLSSMSVLDVKL